MSSANGPISSSIVFVAEAPGRLGAAKTGVPLHGDATGRNFERLLADLGLRREDIFITNVVLCNPVKEGCNRPPFQSEVKNCRHFLIKTIELIAPQLVVALGKTAFDALQEVGTRGFTFPQDCGRPLPWHGRTLFSMFHPSPRNFNNPARRAQLQEQIRRLGEMLDSTGPAAR